MRSFNFPAYPQAFRFLVLLFFAGLVIRAFFWPVGTLGLTYDSADFIDASKSFDTYLHGKNADGFSYLVRAPLLPAYLSFFDNANKIAACWWLNVVCYSASLLVLMRIGKLLQLQEVFLWGGVLTSALTYPFLQNFLFLWSESVFILLILVLACSLIEGRGVTLVLLVCSLLFLTRKPGIFFFGGASISYLLMKKDIKAFLVLSAAGLAIFLAWQFLEHAFSSTGTFLAMVKDLDVYSRVHYADAITSWFLPSRIPLFLRTLIAGLMMTIVIFVYRSELVKVFKRNGNLILLILGGTYSLAFIAFSGASGYMDAERYMNVVLPFWMLLLVALAQQVYLERKGFRRTIFLTGVGLWMLYPIGRTLFHAF